MRRAQRGKDSWERPAPRGGQRRRQVFVFTEGKVTEPSYLDILKDQGVPLADEVPVEMHIANRKADSGRKPLDLVEQAITPKREEDRKAKRATRSAGCAARPSSGSRSSEAPRTPRLPRSSRRIRYWAVTRLRGRTPSV